MHTSIDLVKAEGMEMSIDVRESMISQAIEALALCASDMLSHKEEMMLVRRVDIVSEGSGASVARVMGGRR